MNSEKRLIWNPLYIGIITYFCLVLPGIILFARNFEKLEKKAFRIPTLVFGSMYFVLLILGWIFLPESWDLALNIAHIGIALGLAALQYPYYRRFLDDEETEEERGVESLIKPALLSLVFALLLVSAGIGWEWYQNELLKGKMSLAMTNYDSGNYRDAVNGLNEIIESYPGESLAYTNLSITYETMGKADSAIYIMQEWLKIAPEDKAAEDRVYELMSGN
ncbi:MAG: hypothetical protein WED33_02550 [Bacteroidia bacterium]